jgi:hypothetical protein
VQINPGDLVEVIPSKKFDDDPNMLALAVGYDKRGWVTVTFVTLPSEHYEGNEYHYPYHKLRLVSRGCQ